MSNWKDVRKGFVVEDKTGQQWTVIKREPGQVFTISAPGREPWRGALTGEVTIVSQPAPQADPDVVARGLLAVKFGGVEVSKFDGKDRTKPHMTPVQFADPGALLAHLSIFHGATSDDPTLAGLVKFHAGLHHPNEKSAELFEPHVHTPDFDEL